MPSGRSCAVNASNASAPSAIARDGLPFARNSPSTYSRSSSAISSWCAAMARAFISTWSVARSTAVPPTDSGAGPVAVEPERRDRGVGVQHVDVVDRDAELLGDDHRPARLVALAVRRGAGDDLHLAGGEHAHRGRLPTTGRVLERREHAARREAAHLDVAREADAEVLRGSGGPPLGLLGAHVLVADHLEGAVERGLVVTRVEHQAGRRGVRELVGRDEVAPPDLGRIDRRPCGRARRSRARSRTSLPGGPRRGTRRSACGS